MMEQRQAGFNKLMENVGARAQELDRMMNSYSNMLEQSLSQAELRARKVTELLAKDSAEKSQVAIREIERLRQDAQVHTQKAVSELQANFSSSHGPGLQSAYEPLVEVLRHDARGARHDAACRGGPRSGANRASAPREGSAGNRKAKRHRHEARAAGSAFRARRSFRSLHPARLFTARCRLPSKDASRQLREQPQGLPPHDAAFSPRPAYDYGQPPSEKAWAQSEPQQPAKALPARARHPLLPRFSPFPEPQAAGTAQSVVSGRPAGAGIGRRRTGFSGKTNSYGLPPLVRRPMRREAAAMPPRSTMLAAWISA